MTPQNMTHSASYYNNEFDRITAAALSAGTNSTSNLNPNEQTFSSSHTRSSAGKRSSNSSHDAYIHYHPSSSPVHNSQIPSDDRAPISALTLGSSSNARAVSNIPPHHDDGGHQQYYCYPEQEQLHYPQQPALAAHPTPFVLGPVAESGSISNNNPTSGWQEQKEWKQMQNCTARDTMSSAESSPHRGGNRVQRYTGGCDDDDDEYGGDDDDESAHENAFLILLRISFLVLPFSLISALYTFAVLLFLILASPLRLCPPSTFFKSSTTFTTQICHILLPLLHTHQRLITTPPTLSQQRRDRNPYRQSSSSSPSSLNSNSRTDNETPNDTNTNIDPSIFANYSTPILLIIHLLSPLLIIPILFAAWISACFWIFAMILGNPDGTERKDDGRAAVLGVRNWWRIWLSRAKKRKKKKRRKCSGRK